MEQPPEISKAFELDKAELPDYSRRFLGDKIPLSSFKRKDHDLYQKRFILDVHTGIKKISKYNKNVNKLTAKEKRKIMIHNVPKTGLRYENFLSLHQLWCQYMAECIHYDKPNFKPFSGQTSEALLRADYHGCLVRVSQSKCPSYVGVGGIIIQDTRETFRIITKLDRVKGAYDLCIYGTNFNYRPMDRVNKKFRRSGTTDL